MSSFLEAYPSGCRLARLHFTPRWQDLSSTTLLPFVSVPGWVAFSLGLFCIAGLLLQYILVIAPGLCVFYARRVMLHLTTCDFLANGNTAESKSLVG